MPAAQAGGAFDHLMTPAEGLGGKLEQSPDPTGEQLGNPALRCWPYAYPARVERLTHSGYQNCADGDR